MKLSARLAVVTLLLISSIAALADIQLVRDTAVCIDFTSWPWAGELGAWTQNIQNGCTQAQTFTYTAGPTVDSCNGNYMESDTALPHGMCHVVRGWYPIQYVTANSACTYITSTQTFYIAYDYQY